MKYAAIIFDLDGTAMPSEMNALPSKTVAETTKKYLNSIILCAATGRPWQLAKPIIRALGLNRPCIVSGGAVIIDPTSEKILWEINMDPAAATKIMEMARQTPYYVTYAKGPTVTWKTPASKVNIDGQVNTIYILDIPAEEADGVIGNLGHIDGITISKAYSWVLDGGIDLHITNSESTKEHAVKKLCELLKVESSDVAGVGDGFNDIHLFNAVGHKIAMGNAVPELKQAADLVIDTIDKDGLAHFIEQSVE